jgi:oxalate decarboxylase/phosphoglucose isomerase-like protein (cupin superfamily)
MILPSHSILIPNQLRSGDHRGSILSIVDAPIKNVSLIKCSEGSIRSNHYHKTDYHFMYVLVGRIDYFFRPMNKQSIEYLEVSEGQSIFTPKLEWHATFFPINTDLVVSSLNPRDQKTYEEDTVREVLLTDRNLGDFLGKYK